MHPNIFTPEIVKCLASSVLVVCLGFMPALKFNIEPNLLTFVIRYHGPLTPIALHNPPIDPQIQRTSEDSSSSEGVPGTPSSATVQEYNPGIVHSNGYVENRHVMPVPESRILSSNAPNGYYPAPPNTEQGYTYAHGQPPPQQAQQHQVPKDAHSDMSAFQVLVDVAANEGKAAATTAY